VNQFGQKTLGVLTGWTGDGPWRSKSVLAALAVVVVGLGFWFADIKNGPPQSDTDTATATTPAVAPPAEAHWNWSKPFPVYVRMGASYVAGFCLGWLFRRLLRLILVAGALALALLAYGKLTGCDLTHAQEQVTRGGEWAQHEATAAESYLKHLLPSAAAGGAGIFLGFRRRNKIDPAGPPA
jgi:uncharacterized membrane protein (Fun14 family)